MLIDWFTVGAQIVNFIILIYLLKRFLYKPILRAMDEREQKIAGRLQEAAKKRELAESEAVSLAEERRELENSREKMREDARAEIEQWRDEAMQQARNEVAETRRTWQDNLEREQNDFVRRLKAVLGRQVFRAAAKAMEDLVDEGLEGKLVETFAGKLPTLIAENEETGRRMGDELEIKSGFELNEQQHNADPLRQNIQHHTSRIRSQDHQFLGLHPVQPLGPDNALAYLADAPDFLDGNRRVEFFQVCLDPGSHVIKGALQFFQAHFLTCARCMVFRTFSSISSI